MGSTEGSTSHTGWQIRLDRRRQEHERWKKKQPRKCWDCVKIFFVCFFCNFWISWISELNSMECRPPRQLVRIHEENVGTTLPVVTTVPDFADHPLGMRTCTLLFNGRTKCLWTAFSRSTEEDSVSDFEDLTFHTTSLFLSGRAQVPERRFYLRGRRRSC